MRSCADFNYVLRGDRKEFSFASGHSLRCTALFRLIAFVSLGLFIASFVLLLFVSFLPTDVSMLKFY